MSATLKDAGYGDVEMQRTPIGTRITLYVTRPGLVIGRKGSGIKDLTAKIEEKFGLSNPQISVQEVSIPELKSQNYVQQNCPVNRAWNCLSKRQLFWTINTINGAGALGVEVSIAGKLRSERAHFEKHSSGVGTKEWRYGRKNSKIQYLACFNKDGTNGNPNTNSNKERSPTRI